MRSLSSRVVAGAFLVLLPGLAGCGSRAGPMLPVSGKVLLNGNAADHGTVVFHPDRSRGNDSRHEPRGAIGGDGRYQLVTGGQAGAPPGWYKVCVRIEKPAANPNDPYAKPVWLSPERYLTEAATPLSVRVAENPAEGAYDFDVK